MNKFLNNTENITAELLEGYTMAYASKVTLAAENIVVRTNPKSADKVAVVTLGGSGHEPALSGFVGEGMLDCSVVGDIFAAPGAQRLFQALQLLNREAGILLVVLNHSGDIMSANMACQLAESMGIKVKSIMTHDDISAGVETPDIDRRGLAGCVPIIKVIGAAAEMGKSLEECLEIGERLNNNIATLAVAMGKCTHPQNGVTISELPEGEMEIGMGQHGEGGGGRQPLKSADEVAEIMLTELMKKVQPVEGDSVLLYINGVGATTHMEMSIVFRKCAMILKEKGIVLAEGRISEILTVQEQTGFQMIFGKLVDDEMVDLLTKCKANTPYWATAL